MASNERDWTYMVARIFGLLGFNEMRLRWKLIRWQDRWKKSGQQAKNRAEWVRHESQVCRACGSLNGGDEKVCAKCGVALPGRAGQVMGRLGVLFGMSPTILLIGVMIAIYIRMTLVQGDGMMGQFSLRTLVEFGGNSPMYTVAEGEWWRLATCVFLHGGLMHLGFNMWAFYMVGPALEQIYGRGRLVLFFMVAGILASFASVMLQSYPVGIGASGAIMGLFGVVGGWGHRQATIQGRQLRNRMLRLVVFVTLFGLMLGQAGIAADHVAHLVGFAVGGLLGVAPLDRLRNPRVAAVLRGLDILAILLALGVSVVCIYPPAAWSGRLGGPSDMRRVIELDPREQGQQYALGARLCAARTAGDATPLEDALGTTDAGRLDAFCRGIAAVEQRCALYRAGGVEAVVGTDTLPADQRAEIDANYQIWCAELD